MININYIIDLHLKENLSTAQIGAMLNIKKNTVLKSLRRANVLKRSLGLDVEDQVIQFLRQKGLTVLKQKGDCTFDILLDGKRVDIKSAHKHKKYGYYFEIKHKLSLFTDYRKDIDYFLLVFLDEPHAPIYRLESSQINVKRNLHIQNLKSTKYPIDLVGYLEF